MAALICVLLDAMGDGARLGLTGIDPKGGGAGGRGQGERRKYPWRQMVSSPDEKLRHLDRTLKPINYWEARH